MANHSVFSTAGRTPSAQMDADLSTLHAPEAAAEVVDEGCRRVRERGQIDIVRCLAPRTPDGEPWISKPSLRPVSTRPTSAWQIVQWPLLAQSGRSTKSPHRGEAIFNDLNRAGQLLEWARHGLTPFVAASPSTCQQRDSSAAGYAADPRISAVIPRSRCRNSTVLPSGSSTKMVPIPKSSGSSAEVMSRRRA